MLKSSINSNDISKPLTYDEGVFHFGESYIEPCQNNILEYFAIHCNQQCLIIIREKNSKTKPIQERFFEVTLGQYEHYTKTATEWPQAIITIEIDPNKKTILFTNGSYSPAPLYFQVEENALKISWNPKDFLNNASLENLDLDQCALFLTGHEYGYKTLFSNIYKLPYKGKFLFSQDDFEIVYPDDEEYIYGKKVSRENELVEAFLDIFQQTIERWTIDQEIACSDLSGGLDSALVSIMLKHINGEKPVLTNGLIYASDCRNQQIKRRQELIEKFEFIDCATDMQNHLTMSDIFSGKYKNPWYAGELYQYGTRTALQNLKQKNGTVVFTGLGGDELTMLTKGEATLKSKRIAKEELLQVPCILNSAYQNQKPQKQWSQMALSESTVASTEMSGIIYLEEGFWPIHPFACKEINQFCRSLPLAWRQDRYIFKKALEYLGMSDEYLNPPRQDEDFGETMNLALTTHQSEIRSLFKKSILCELGVINPEALKNSLHQFYDWNHTKYGPQIAFAMYLENFLQSIAKMQ